MSNKEVDKLIDRIPKKNKYIVTTEEVVNYIFMLENRINKAIEYIENNSLYETIYDYNIDDEQELQYVSDETASNNLLNILRGKDNE